ncbi:ARF-like small GTPase [Zopfochytrium polystomum]|nr:ARF-like small GTPase [Zopfochytrium polystomum]
MGLWTNFLTTLGLVRRKVSVLFVGLDNAGKSTILNGLALNPGRYRDLWEHYYQDAEAVVFVIDAADKMRACVARDELRLMLEHKVLRAKKIPILFLANKMDVAGGMTPAECSGALGLEEIKDRNWTICATNGLTGQGVNTGLDWLAAELS